MRFAPKGRDRNAGYPEDIPTLTSLRFFAALFVVFFHYSWWRPEINGTELGNLINIFGETAVDFFFILSGFILVHAHRAQILQDTLVAPHGFYVKRLARIYPLHIATLVFYLVMVLGLHLIHKPMPNPDRYTAGQFIINVLLLQALQVRDAGAWNYPAWSISAEWVAYLCFPFFALAIYRAAARIGTVYVLALSIAFFLTVYFLSPFLTGLPFAYLHSNFGFLRVYPEFLLGMAMYFFLAEKRIPALGHRSVLPALMIAILVSAHFGLWLSIISLTAVVIASVAERSRSGAPSVLNHSALVYLGQISFALYMVHVPISTLLLQGIKSTGHVVSVALIVFAIPVAIVAAAIAHHCVEKPGHRFVMWLFSPKRRMSTA